MPPEVRNRGISGPTKRTYVLKNLEKQKQKHEFKISINHLIQRKIQDMFATYSGIINIKTTSKLKKYSYPDHNCSIDLVPAWFKICSLSLQKNTQFFTGQNLAFTEAERITIAYHGVYVKWVPACKMEI